METEGEICEDEGETEGCEWGDEPGPGEGFEVLVEVGVQVFVVLIRMLVDLACGLHVLLVVFFHVHVVFFRVHVVLVVQCDSFSERCRR